MGKTRHGNSYRAGILQKTEKDTEQQTLRKTDIDQTKEVKKLNDRQIIQNALEFADDAKPFTQHDTRGQMNERIGNYYITTETRRLTIQWNKVLLLRRERHKLREALPPPFNEIQHKSTGAILGKEISMAGSLKQAVPQRIEKHTAHGNKPITDY